MDGVWLLNNKWMDGWMGEGRSQDSCQPKEHDLCGGRRFLDWKIKAYIYPIESNTSFRGLLNDVRESGEFGA